MQGTFVSEKEIDAVVNYIKENNKYSYNEDIIQSIENTPLKGKGNKPSMKDDEFGEETSDEDPLLEDAINLVIDMGQASASMIQRKFKVGYSRAGRIIDQMEERGLISGYDGSKPRQVLVTKQQWQELKMGQNDAQNEEKGE